MLIDDAGEFIDRGDAKRKLPAHQVTYKVMNEALEQYKLALRQARQSTQTTPKERARIFQKLMETSTRSSMLAPKPKNRTEHAREAQVYGDASLKASVESGDQCMTAQVEFMLACVAVWSMHLQNISGKSTDAESKVRLDLENALIKLKRYPELKIRLYEEQRKVYLGYLSDQSCS